MKAQTIIQQTLSNRYPSKNIVITKEGDLEFDHNSEAEELEIINFANGVAFGVSETLKYLKNESI